MGDLGLIPGLERSPRGGNGYPLQYSGLENPMDFIVHGVTKSWTQLSDFHSHLYIIEYYSAIKRNKVSCSEVDEPRACYADEVCQQNKNKYSILTHTYGI